MINRIKAGRQESRIAGLISQNILMLPRRTDLPPIERKSDGCIYLDTRLLGVNMWLEFQSRNRSASSTANVPNLNRQGCQLCSVEDTIKIHRMLRLISSSKSLVLLSGLIIIMLPSKIKAMTRADLSEEIHDLRKADITMSEPPNLLDNAVCAFGERVTPMISQVSGRMGEVVKAFVSEFNHHRRLPRGIALAPPAPAPPPPPPNSFVRS